MDHHTVPNGVHRRAVGVVELDALVGLEVAAHCRAEAVRLVDVRLVMEIDWPTEPGVAGVGRAGPRDSGGRVRQLLAERLTARRIDDPPRGPADVLHLRRFPKGHAGGWACPRVE